MWFAFTEQQRVQPVGTIDSWSLSGFWLQPPNTRPEIVVSTSTSMNARVAVARL
jgi:hypothetical protein